jgi:formylglycine-generating enzyme required for sulfatase activity
MNNPRVRWLAAAVVLGAVVVWPWWPEIYATSDRKGVQKPKEFTNSIGMKLVRIPAGKFTMGSPKTEKDRSDNEMEHKVEITKPFYMGIHEVTQKQYKAVIGKNPSYFSSEGKGKDEVKGLDTDDFPVEQVSWEDAQKFCTKLTTLEKKKGLERVYRLPTEAEWEYACRGGTRSSTPFHYGNSLSSLQANFDGNYPYGGADKERYLARTTTVGSYKKNGFGLYDMHGNVWEWCQDWYDKDYYQNSPKKDPKGPDKVEFRVLRGGSWILNGWVCRSAYRFYNVPGGRYGSLGFRVVCSVGVRTE